jgi:hypothetical protein
MKAKSINQFLKKSYGETKDFISPPLLDFLNDVLKDR